MVTLTRNTLFNRLNSRELIIPYIDQALSKDEWPSSYQIQVDTRPHDSRVDDYFHPSSHCIPGPRKLQMMIDPRFRDKILVEKMSPTSMMTISYGSALHAILQTQLKMAGILTEEQIEVPLVNEDLHARGHMDFLLDHPNGNKYCVDIKTRNSRGFDNDRGPLPEWVAQLNCYMDWIGVDDAIVLVVESGYPFRMKEWHFKKSSNVIDPIYKKWRYVRGMIERGEEIMDMCCTPASLDKYCPARFLCWEGK